MKVHERLVSLAAALAFAGACAQKAQLTPEQLSGPAPPLPAPERALLPTVKIAPAIGWRSGQTPTAAAGLRVQPFATGLDHPRWLYVLPNGDVLVAETNKPPTPDPASNPVRDAFMKHVMEKAGAAVPSANRITLLRDAD